MIARIDAAILKFEKALAAMPIDKQVEGNKDYDERKAIINSLTMYKKSIEKLERQLTALGV